MGILHVDAHADLRQAYEGFTWSHASIMYNVLEHVPDLARLVQVGIRDLGDAEYALIEKSEWTMMCHRMIWHGRRCCHARKPACGACPVAHWCPSFGLGPTDPVVAAGLLTTEGRA